MPHLNSVVARAVAVGSVVACGSVATAQPLSTALSSEYLIIALEVLNGNTDVATNNFELGANKAPVPANTSFIDSGGGPTLEGAVPALPSNAMAFFQGVDYSGNVAVTDPNGEFELQDVGVYANPQVGIRVAGTSTSLNKSSNAFFNDPNMFPNTFDIGTQTGTNVNPGDAVQSTRIDPDGTPGNAGVTYGFDFTNLLNELGAAEMAINSYAATMTLDTGGDGKIDSDTTVTLSSGLNIIDIDTGGGNDFLIENSNFVIDGPADAFAIFRITGMDNMLISNANVIVSDTMGKNNVLFFAGDEDNDGTNFSFSNTLLNGAAFWSLGNSGSIDISNAQGSTQLVADIVDLDNVRFTRWAFNIPAPSTGLLIAAGACVLGRRRR